MKKGGFASRPGSFMDAMLACRRRRVSAGRSGGIRLCRRGAGSCSRGRALGRGCASLVRLDLLPMPLVGFVARADRRYFVLFLGDQLSLPTHFLVERRDLVLQRGGERLAGKSGFLLFEIGESFLQICVVCLRRLELRLDGGERTVASEIDFIHARI